MQQQQQQQQQHLGFINRQFIAVICCGTFRLAAVETTCALAQRVTLLAYIWEMSNWKINFVITLTIWSGRPYHICGYPDYTLWLP